MLIAAGGVLAGYNGSFEFDQIGVVYPDGVPYITMRAVSFLFYSLVLLFLQTAMIRRYIFRWICS